MEQGQILVMLDDMRCQQLVELPTLTDDDGNGLHRIVSGAICLY